MSKIMLQTPVGKIEWFNLVKVDKFNAYTCNLILEDSPETLAFKEQIDTLAKGTKVPYTMEADGGIKVKLKLKAQGQKKTGEMYNVLPPVIYSKAGIVLTVADVMEANVGNGSSIIAKVELSTYDVNGSQGVSCKPKAVVLKNIVQFSSGADVGFDPSEFEDFDAGETPVEAKQSSSDF